MFTKALFVRTKPLKDVVMELAVWSTRGRLDPEDWAMQNAREVAALG